MKISFISKKSIDPGLVKLAKTLPINKSFMSSIKKLKVRYKIPKDGFNDKRFLEGLKLYDKNSEKINKEILVIIKKFSLPQNWASELVSLIIFNRCYINESDIELELSTKDKSSISIVINNLVSKNQLKKWIDGNWDTIDLLFKKNDLRKTKKIRRKRLHLIMEAIELNESGLQIKEVVTRLNNKYGSDKSLRDFVSDEVAIRQAIKRLKADIGYSS